MFYNSKFLKENEHVIKGYHLSLDIENVVSICINGTNTHQENGMNGQKGGMFLWTHPSGVSMWLNRLIACEKSALENGIVSATPVPEKVYVLEFQIPKKDFRHPIWQADFALVGNYFIPLMTKHYYKLYKSNLLSEETVALYLRCPTEKSKRYFKNIQGLSLKNNTICLNMNSQEMSLSQLKRNSAYYSGIIQRLHDYLYVKSLAYAQEYDVVLKKMLKRDVLSAVKYCGNTPLKPVSVEV